MERVIASFVSSFKILISSVEKKKKKLGKLKLAYEPAFKP
jgi:hypothetical protein